MSKRRRAASTRKEETPTASAHGIARREWWLLGLIILVAIGLRIAWPTRVAIEHYDEGVYASNAFFPTERGSEYPKRHLYAPPSLPWLLETWQLMTGLPSEPHGGWPVILLFSLATIPLVWAIARQVHPAAGLPTAALLAMSDLHLVYSRAMLTDAVLLAPFAAAALCWLLAMRNRSLGWALIAGLATGFGWSIKYNGWLALAVILAATLPWWLFSRDDESRPSAKSMGARLAITLLTACACFYPVLAGLESHGGYATVSENHERFFVGISGWWNSLVEQFANLRALEGPVSWIGWFAGGTLVARENGRYAFPFGLLVMSLGMLLTTAGLLFLLGGSWTVITLLRAIRERKGSLADWMIAAWFWGLFLATPLYTPYPRLTLLWLCPAIIASGASLRAIASHSAIRKPIPLPLGIAVVLAAGGWFVNGTTRVAGWEDRTQFAQLAEKILPAVQKSTGDGPKWNGVRFILYVHAEPGLYFQLRRQHPGAAPYGGFFLAGPKHPRHPVPTFVLVGPHSLRQRPTDVDWKRYKDQFELIAIYRYQPSTFVSLNQRNPSESERVELYRLRE